MSWTFSVAFSSHWKLKRILRCFCVAHLHRRKQQ